MYEDVWSFDPEWENSKIPDFHAVVSIQLCELIDADFFDLSREDWDFGPKYSEEQHKKLCDKITAHFFYREIALTPPGVWKHEFLRKMNEIMPKYMPLYKAIEESPELIGASSEYYKSRNIFSDFPQVQLSGKNGDYASAGNDTQYERIHQLDTLELAEKLKEYQDVDALIIEEIEPLFSCLFTVNVNAF